MSLLLINNFIHSFWLLLRKGKLLRQARPSPLGLGYEISTPPLCSG